MPQPDPEEVTEREIEEDAARSDTDDITDREALETALMDADDSEAGEEIGQHID
jgi:hypothetical protein